ncbi:hypothetical protein Goklo_023537, partial [Gossypium klotzschianum]|nr:hypothetical protein [Gossypium klotzschianum]
VLKIVKLAHKKGSPRQLTTDFNLSLLGNWIILYIEGVVKSDVGFNHYLGDCSVFEAELWGVIDGLILLERQGFNKVLINTNNLEVVNALQDRQLADSSSILLRKINRILKTIDLWSVGHIPRETNQVVVYIIKMTFNKTFAIQVFEDAHEQLEAGLCTADRINGLLAYDDLTQCM